VRNVLAALDRSKSRLAGFHEYQPTLGSFLDLFARLRRGRIIPWPRGSDERCSVEHVGLTVSGVATAAFADGRVIELRPPNSV
jgi:hypothetical protein